MKQTTRITKQKQEKEEGGGRKGTGSSIRGWLRFRTFIPLVGSCWGTTLLSSRGAVCCDVITCDSSLPRSQFRAKKLYDGQRSFTFLRCNFKSRAFSKFSDKVHSWFWKILFFWFFLWFFLLELFGFYRNSNLIIEKRFSVYELWRLYNDSFMILDYLFF